MPTGASSTSCGKTACPSRRVLAIGGGAASDVWLQMKADVLGLPVFRTAVKEASLAGACMLAMQAAGPASPSCPDLASRPNSRRAPSPRPGTTRSISVFSRTTKRWQPFMTAELYRII